MFVRGRNAPRIPEFKFERRDVGPGEISERLDVFFRDKCVCQAL